METSSTILVGATWINKATGKKLVLTGVEYKWVFARDVESRQLIRLRKTELLEHYDYYPKVGRD